MTERFSDREIYEFGTVALFCSPEHFWGQSVVFKYHSDGVDRRGILCRLDWPKVDTKK
jgi:hypothetical protein